MDKLGQGPSSALDSTYGAMLIGGEESFRLDSSTGLFNVHCKSVFFATFFQGLLTVQTYNYFENFPEDPTKNKVIVRSFFVVYLKHGFELFPCSGCHRLVWTELLAKPMNPVLINTNSLAQDSGQYASWVHLQVSVSLPGDKLGICTSAYAVNMGA